MQNESNEYDFEVKEAEVSEELILEQITKFMQTEAYEYWKNDIRMRYDGLFREAMSEDLSDAEVRRKLEMMRGMMFSVMLFDGIAETLRQNIENRKDA